jgi:hypothetical protein
MFKFLKITLGTILSFIISLYIAYWSYVLLGPTILCGGGGGFGCGIGLVLVAIIYIPILTLVIFVGIYKIIRKLLRI